MDTGLPDDELWYTSTNGLIVTLNSTTGFLQTVISNTYSNGKGIIKFDGPVTLIGDNAFLYKYNLTSISIPNKCTDICKDAFKSSSLKNIKIPNSVTHIDWTAFHSSSLESIFIPKSVTYIGRSGVGFSYGIFNECSQLSSIVVESGNPIYDSRDNCNAIILTSTNKLLSGCKNTVIPNSITTIRDHAFDCSNLINIFIPSNITHILSGAFSNCRNLSSITVSTDNLVYDSRNNCNAIIKTSSNALIAGCKNTVIPSTVKSLGAYAFAGNLYSPVSISIPEGVEEIKSNCFYTCYGLSSIVLPDSITTISPCFNLCNGLRTVVFGSGLLSITSDPFFHSNHVTTITCKAVVPPSLAETFNYCTLLEVIYVPAESVEAYKAAPNWSVYASKIQAIPE